MTDDEKKLYIQALLEVQKQNQEISKTVLTLLIPLVASFATVTSAIFLSTAASAPINKVNEPYVITILITFQIFMLWDSQWRAGYQKYVEEKINSAFGTGVVEWEALNDLRKRKWSVPNFGTNSVMMILWVMSMIAGVSAVRPIHHDYGRDLHIAGYSLSAIFIVAGYASIFTARSRGYNYSKHGCNADEKKIGLRAYAIWEREGRLSGKEEEYWGRAKAEIECNERNWL